MRTQLMRAFGHLIGGIFAVAVSACGLLLILTILGFWCRLMTEVFMFGWRAFPY